jgi:hypothetical protein
MSDAMMSICPACGRSLGLADRNGLHVADEAHYPHRDESGAMRCTWLSRPSERSASLAGGPQGEDLARGVRDVFGRFDAAPALDAKDNVGKGAGP